MVTASKRRPLQQLMKEHLLAVAGHRCALCHEPLMLPETHLDHIIPLARGGADALPNLQVTHRRCNLEKAARLAGEPSVADRERELRAAVRQRQAAKLIRRREEQEQRELAKLVRQREVVEQPIDPAVRKAVMREYADMRKRRDQPCANCGTVFTAYGRGQYCSAKCRTAAYRRRKTQQDGG